MSLEHDKKFSLKNAVDSHRGYFFLTDGKSVVLYSNRALENTTGFSVAEIVGKRPGDLWGGEMPPRFYQRLWREIRIHKHAFTHSVMNRAKNGHLYRQKLFIVPVIDDALNARYFMSFQPLEGETFFSIFLKRWNRLSSRQQLPFFFEKVAPRIFSGTSGFGFPNTESEGNLCDVLRDVFVLPMRERFRRREDDSQFVLQAQKDPENFRFLYERYYGDIYRYFFHHVGGHVREAEDLCQETFLRAFRYLPQYRSSNASYATYLFRIAHSLLVNFYRKRLIAVPYADRGEDFRDDFSFSFASELWRFVAQLSDIERQVVTMKYREDMSVREIAEALQKSENAIKLHLSRARRKLRRKLTDVRD